LVAPPLPPPARRGFQLIASANAAEAAPLHRGPAAAGQWAIQVGAFTNPNQARAALGSAQAQARAELAVAHPFVAGVHQPHGQLWRARLTGLSRETAGARAPELRGAVAGVAIIARSLAHRFSTPL